ncbi:FAD-binding protein [Pseudonocardia adelaidensis]|uniref:FAD-binding PCMH-type domain-containing protein n=1 Tax=Pseudonocardia adelaidensis TaxID=648754 RepID=A0ABP9NC86_9PSEU
MVIEVGIAVAAPASEGDLEGLIALVRRAEAAGLELVVVGQDAAEGVDEPGPGFDAWTTAVWIAGSTSRISIGVPSPTTTGWDPTDAEARPSAIAAKARESLDVLAPGRLVPAEPGWVTAPRGAGPPELAELGVAGLPVVVPVGSVAEVERLAALVTDGAAGSRPRRTAAARARRRPDIDYDGLPASLVDVAIEPGDPDYRSVTSTYLRGGAPGLVLRPRSPAEVADALAFARRHMHLPLGIRSGGHGISGRSTNKGGLVIDVGRLNRIEVVDADRRLVRIGPGATWKQVAAALDAHGWALGSGDYGGVGVGGLATAGGIGYLSRRHGLTIDHIRAVDVVLADGRLVRASATENPELFWAVRGAGANFGVVVAFEFEADEVGDVGYAQLTLTTPDLENALREYGRIASTAPRDTTVFLVTGRPRQGLSVLQLYGMVDSSEPDVIVERLTPFAEFADLRDQMVVLTRYKDVMSLAADVGPDGQHGFGEPVSRSAFLPALTDEFARDAAELLRSGLVYFFELRSMGGAIADVPEDAMAFAHRTPAFQVTVMGKDQQALNAAWDAFAPHVDGLYLSFDTDLRPERLRDAFPPPVLERLRRIKRRYDPGNVFRDNFNIDPRTDAGSRRSTGAVLEEELAR